MKSIQYAVLAITLLPSIGLTYPPDNAAVLYHKAFSLIEHPEDRESRDAIWNYAKGNVDLTNDIDIYLDKHQAVIRILLDAAEVTQCDWGIDYSQGIDVLFPTLAPARQAGFILLGQARRDFSAGNVEQAIDLCFSVYRMGRHVDNECMVSHLVGIALYDVTNNVIRDLVSQLPPDEEFLTQLKARLDGISVQRNTLKAAIQKDILMFANSICPEGRDSIIKCYDGHNSPQEKNALEQIKTADTVFFEKSRQHYLEFMNSVQNALDLPLAEAQFQLLALAERPLKEAETNKYAIVTATLVPVLWPCLQLDARGRTDFNALQAGLNLLLIKARTGSLPDTLPANMPKNLFNNQDFTYKRTGQEFRLNYECLGRALEESETREIVFQAL